MNNNLQSAYIITQMQVYGSGYKKEEMHMIWHNAILKYFQR